MSGVYNPDQAVQNYGTPEVQSNTWYFLVLSLFKEYTPENKLSAPWYFLT